MVSGRDPLACFDTALKTRMIALTVPVRLYPGTRCNPGRQMGQ